MYPTLFSIGSFSISSFGLFLALAVFAAVFVSWKLARLYDLNEEKILDLIILTFFGGMMGARILFVAEHLKIFNTVEKFFLLNRYPGLSFWGGLLGGIISLWVFSKRLKFSFWQIADFAAVATLLGIIIGDWGCLLSGCSYGVPSNLGIATPVVGVLGRRLPIAAIESLVLIPIYIHLWKQVIRFHFAGRIASSFLLMLGIVKLGIEYYHGDSLSIANSRVTQGHLFALAMIFSGIIVFYVQSRRNFIEDIRQVIAFFLTSKKRQATLGKWQRGWYNYKVSWKIRTGKIARSVKNLPRKMQRKLNVKPNPTNFSQN